MGFSAIPPRPDFNVLLAALDLWTRRADAAILHFEPPWDTLLAGAEMDSAVILQHQGLVNYYRSKGLAVVITIDATNGLDRSAESAALVAAGRSLAEPDVQQLYRDYAVAVDTLLRPDYLGLAAETNLIRAAALPSLYAAVVQVANAAAADVRAVDPAVKLYASVQVETAWGRLGGGSTYVGIATDLADFPFMQVVGLSSYPYLGGFAEPEDLPLDYYSRLTTLPKSLRLRRPGRRAVFRDAGLLGHERRGGADPHSSGRLDTGGSKVYEEPPWSRGGAGSSISLWTRRL